MCRVHSPQLIPSQHSSDRFLPDQPVGQAELLDQCHCPVIGLKQMVIELLEVGITHPESGSQTSGNVLSLKNDHIVTTLREPETYGQSQRSSTEHGVTLSRGQCYWVDCRAAATIAPKSPGFKLAPPTRAPSISGMESSSSASLRSRCQESFGPIVPVMAVESDEEALARMNDSRLGLTASVWTSDRERAARFARSLECGTVFMNRCDYLDPALPWSGWKILVEA